MRFELTLLGADGALVRRHVEAASESAARASVAAGEHPIACRASRAAPWRATGGGRRELLAFCEALEQVLAGGLTLAEALRALSADGESRGAATSRLVLRGLDAGLAPSRAFEETGLGFSPFLLALVRSGERTGQLPQALERFVRFERSLLEMRARVVSASMYPVVLFGVSLAVLGFLLGFVVPRFAAAMDDLRTELPAASRLLFELGLWVSSHGVALLAGVAAAVALVVAIAGSPSGRVRVGGLFARLPGARGIAELAGRAQALRVIAALLGGGATLSTALGVARSTSGPVLADRLQDAAARVDRGDAPSQALAGSGLAGPVAVQLLAAAERTGGLAPCFERLATVDEARLERLLERMTTAWGPLLLLGVAAVVGGVVMALYWPMLQVFESIR